MNITELATRAAGIPGCGYEGGTRKRVRPRKRLSVSEIAFRPQIPKRSRFRRPQ
jgi:hypothetical protein